MAIQVALTHETRYLYDRPVMLGPQVVRLRPAPHCRTPIISYSLKVLPKRHFLNWQQDPQSNYLARLIFPERTTEFVVTVDLVAEMAIINPFDFFLEEGAEQCPFAYDPAMMKELKPYLEKPEPGPLVAKFLAGFDRKKRATIDYLVDLNRAVQERVKYVVRLEPGIQPPEYTLEAALGSCRDSGWLLVQLLRHLGLAARFVSGYLVQLAPDQAPLDGPAGPTEDFIDLHAWAEVYLPGAGWIGLDPTSGLLAGEGHIPLAASPDPEAAAPISGAVEHAEVEFSHRMTVTRIAETPRTTKPYSRAQWGAIEALGQAVDRDLAAGDVRLTMGGEPTFVAIDDMDGDEWNTSAVGPTKRKLSGQLLTRLMRRFAPGGLPHFGQGKWYPGESLPRWALTIYWRKDGDALWSNHDFLASEDVDYGFGQEEATRFLTTLAQRLGVPAGGVLAAFEDPWHYLRREALLPVNVDPLDSKLDDKEERARLETVFNRGLGVPRGFVLPLERRHEAIGPFWQTSAWPTRLKHLLLIPGDSPLGYRLPMAALPWVSAGSFNYIVPPDPTVSQPALPRRPLVAPNTARNAAPGPSQAHRTNPTAPPTAGQARMQVPTGPAERGDNASWVVRTALCVEPRNGRLYVFLPPLESLEDFVALIAAIEQAAIETGLPVVLEGYPPPRDPRISSLAVTPDPGVIEVNIHPSANWTDLSQTITGIYEDARQTRLGTEKFMVDGHHIGTGGGNHITVGGATTMDSPFLRRPDLLRSLIGYWQHHPALSFLFSGLFIGPTSQAPRVDEARDDAIYELDIAFKEIERAGSNCPPWLIDRALRHLLVDVEGNTHRTEFCIDKLYSPDSATGRLGLVELRAFEMPPHPEMSLVQQLVLRAVIAWMWRTPYKKKLLRWGNELHDRFMLPFHIEQDIKDVVADLRAAGYPFEESWFTPHIAFRFPVHGIVAPRGIEIELRHALEPWPVLGEQPGAGGAVRYVDSSIERLQVRVRGMVEGRHAIACNGWKMPLHPTGIEGERVAGVRFRAWWPAVTLHPTVPIHAPLVFDLVDEWSGRSLGGCTYHVAHPGGRSFETRPVNAHEAEGRRLARFQPFGHTPGPFQMKDPGPNPEFPMTLDLRRV